MRRSRKSITAAKGWEQKRAAKSDCKGLRDAFRSYRKSSEIK